MVWVFLGGSIILSLSGYYFGYRNGYEHALSDRQDVYIQGRLDEKLSREGWVNEED